MPTETGRDAKLLGALTHVTLIILDQADAREEPQKLALGSSFMRSNRQL